MYLVKIRRTKYFKGNSKTFPFKILLVKPPSVKELHIEE